MDHFTTKRRGCCVTLHGMPPFARDEHIATHRPPHHATIWRVSLSPAVAFRLICDIGHLYPVYERRPRVGGMLEDDGVITLYIWPSVDPDSPLLMLMINYGTTRLADASHWNGQAWIAGDLLAKVLAHLAHRDHWRMINHDPRLLADERPGHLLAQPRQVLP